MAEPSNGAAGPEKETPIVEDAAEAQESTTQENTETKSHTPHSNRTGWDGKLRLNSEKQAVLANPEALEDSDYEDEDAPPVDQIAADEGMLE
jgi:protein phosphatase 1 regulatory subunit 7